MGCCGIKSKNDLGKAFGCMSLGAFAMVFCVIQMAFSAYQIWSVYNSRLDSTASVTFGYIYAGLQLALGAFSMFAVLVKWAPGVNLLKFILAFIVGSWIVAIILRWIIWIANMNGQGTEDGEKWKPEGVDYFDMAFTTFIGVACIVLGYYIMSIFSSLARVITVGGTGFEGLSYKQLTTGSKGANFDDSDSDDV